MRFFKLPSKTAASTAVKALASGPRELRTVSNLKPNAKFAIDRAKRFQSGLYFFNNKFKGKVKQPELLFLSLVSQILFPSVTQKFTVPFIRSKFKPLLDIVAEDWSESGASSAVSVRRDDEKQRFIATVPVLALRREGMPYGLAKAPYLASGDTSIISDPQANFLAIENKAREMSTGGEKKFSMDSLTAVGNLSELFVANAKSIGVQLVIRPSGNYDLVLLEVPFSKVECEALCNSEWLTIRPLDMYGMINAWVNGYYGRRSRSPASTIPLADIAKESDSKKAEPRLSTEGVMINEDGELYALPIKLNNIYQYEDSTNSAMSHPDGSFSSVSPEGKHITPPPAMPVYVDWVNLKFAYTSLDGKLLVMNLDRSQPMNVTHARRFLETRLETDLGRNFLSFALQLCKFSGVLTGDEPTMFLKSLVKEVETLGLQIESYQSAEEIPLVNVHEYSVAATDGDGHNVPPGPYCIRFVSMMHQLRKFIQENPTNAYARYSVTTVMTVMAQVIVFLDYGSKYAEVITNDNTKRHAYMNQGVDPDYKLPPVPLVESGRGLLPHQGKVQNLLRDRPDNAMLPVDAGGGKTSLVVYEILREIMELDDKQSLSLVMCPSHLVAQYVKEFAYFTGARVNVIPVTSYTIRRQGFKRLEAMIRNAPPNTIVVSDYNAILLGNSSIAYGSSVVRTFPVIEFLRQFYFKYVACDESHFLKNGSSRNAAVGRLIIDIKRKRLASGTLVADTITDLVRQTALMDPTVFGTEAEFIQKYAQEVRGSKVIKWKDGAELAIKRQLSNHVVIAEAKRKEWAAILPFPRIFFHPVELTPNQQKAYHEVLGHVVATILEKAKENKVLAALLEGKTDPDELGADLDALMKPYLARLERFITAPGKDAYGSTVLTGDDLISPKVHEINKIVKDHIDGNVAGKVLIFTNYELSTDAIWDGLALAGLQDQAIYYTAGNKEECGAEFEKNPKKKIMVGIEQSLNTGLNLQFCSVLIRVESVWTPGVMEQGNSRIGRPNIKVREERKEIYYHTIAANRTIDVTKTAYLMAKTVSKAKFDEAGNPRFDDLEAPPLLKMTLDTIQYENDWNETMAGYFDKYQAYQQAQFAEYAEYRENHSGVLFDAAGNLKIQPLERAPNPEGVALMRRIPYVPGTELYKSSDLGLLRYDDFLSKHHTAHVEDEEEEEQIGEDEEGADDEDDKEVNEKKLSAEKLAALLAERNLCTGLAVHTDFGDGEIVRVSTKTLLVKLPSGEVIKVRKLSAFIITRANTSGKDIRNQLLKLTGDVPVDKPIDVLEVKIDPKIEEASKRQMERDKKKTSEQPISMALSLTVANDFLGISMDSLDDERAVKVAQGAGFQFTQSYFAAQVKMPRQLLQFFRLLKDKGFDIDKEGNQACADAYLHFKANRTTSNLFYGYATSASIKNFFRKEFKPKADKMFVQPYPLIQDGKLYLCLPKDGHPGSLNAIRKTTGSSLRWLVYDEDSELINFVGSKPQASSVIQRLIGLGINITNLKQLKKEFMSLRMAKRGEDEVQ